MLQTCLPIGVSIASAHNFAVPGKPCVTSLFTVDDADERSKWFPIIRKMVYGSDTVKHRDVIWCINLLYP